MITYKHFALYAHVHRYPSVLMEWGSDGYSDMVGEIISRAMAFGRRESAILDDLEVVVLREIRRC